MKTRLVFKVNIARKLVRMGYRIVDLKPAKTKDGKTDFNKSIFMSLLMKTTSQKKLKN